MMEHKEIAVDSAQLPDGSLPQQLKCAKRSPHQAKQYQNDNLGLDTYEIPPGPVLLVIHMKFHHLRNSYHSGELMYFTSVWQSIRTSAACWDPLPIELWLVDVAL